MVSCPSYLYTLQVLGWKLGYSNIPAASRLVFVFFNGERGDEKLLIKPDTARVREDCDAIKIWY